MSGALDINASDKASRFIRFCNAFNIPLVTFVDVPGFLPGVQQEHGGIIRHGAKLLFAYSAATVPKIQVILRKAYGGAYLAMCSQGPGRRPRVRLADGRDRRDGRRRGGRDRLPQGDARQRQDKAARAQELIEQYRATFANPYVAAGRRLVDDIIEPADTRSTWPRRWNTCTPSANIRPPKKHGLIPAVEEEHAMKPEMTDTAADRTPAERPAASERVREESPALASAPRR